MRSFAVAFGAIAVSASTDFGLTPEFSSQIENSLNEVCGEGCQKFWADMKDKNAPETNLQKAVESEMQETQSRLSALENSSFLKAGDSCTYGRLGAMASYQGLNVGAHTLGVVTKSVCGCVDVFTTSQCFLRNAPQSPCEPMNNMFESLLRASTEAWGAVKASTNSCNRISFLNRPTLNLHVGASDSGSSSTAGSSRPVVTQTSDAATGSFGHTSITVPNPARIYSSFMQYAPLDLPREIFSDVNKGSQSVINIIPEASFLKARGLDSTLASMYPGATSSDVSAALGDALAASAVAEDVAYADVACSKNFAGCPSGWSGTGSACTAPNGASLDFGGLTPAEKAGIAAQMGGSFACA